MLVTILITITIRIRKVNQTNIHRKINMIIKQLNDI